MCLSFMHLFLPRTCIKYCVCPPSFPAKSPPSFWNCLPSLCTQPTFLFMVTPVMTMLFIVMLHLSPWDLGRTGCLTQAEFLCRRVDLSENGPRYKVERLRALHGWGAREKDGSNLWEKQIPKLGHWDLLFPRPSLCFTLRFYETPQCTYDKACAFFICVELGI